MMTKGFEPATEMQEKPSLPERLDDRIAAVNPDIWLAGALIAVIVPWLSHLA